MTSAALQAVEELPLPLRLLLGCALGPVLLPIVVGLTAVSVGLFLAVETIACLFAVPLLPFYLFADRYSENRRALNRINTFCILNHEILELNE